MDEFLGVIRSIYHPYRAQVSPLFLQLGLQLDEQKEIGVLLLISSVLSLLLTYLLARLFLRPPSRRAQTSYEATHVPQQRKKVRVPKNKERASNKEVSSAETTTNSESGAVESDAAVGDATKRENENIEQPATPMKETELQATSDQDKVPEPEINPPEPEATPQQVDKEGDEKEKETAELDNSTSEEQPGSERRNEKEVQPAGTPLRRSSRQTATPQRFSPSQKKRVRKVD